MGYYGDRRINLSQSIFDNMNRHVTFEELSEESKNEVELTEYIKLTKIKGEA